MKRPTVMVGGTFNAAGGKPSAVFSSICAGYEQVTGKDDIEIINGGSLGDLMRARDIATKCDVVIWMAHVSNLEPKDIARTVKVLNPTAVFVTSKRVIEKAYTVPAIIQHALNLHSNLMVVIERQGDRFHMKLIDPLGNEYYDGDLMMNCGQAIAYRVSYLRSLPRVRSEQASPAWVAPTEDQTEFLRIVRSSAGIFAGLIPHVDEVHRFVGNAAFRCTHGFPAFKEGENQPVFISRRNVDKTIASATDFVPVMPDILDNTLRYFGPHKPSVDAPIQVNLFRLYPKIRYLLHGHVYAAGVPTTRNVVPCGALTEVNEIWEQIPDDNVGFFVVNLRGHGFIAGADEPTIFNRLLSTYVARQCPENQHKWLEHQRTHTVVPLGEDEPLP